MNFNVFEFGNLIYTIIFFLLLFITIFTYGQPKSRLRNVYIVFILLEILLAGLRSEYVGTDTSTYLYHLENLRNYNISEIIGLEDRDPFCYAFLYLIYQPFTSYTPFFFILGVIEWSLIGFILYKYTDNILLALLVFILFRYPYFLLSAMRQGLALSIVFVSYYFLVKDKKILFIICILLASLFHRSSLIFLVVFFMRNIIIYDKKILVFLFILGAFFSSYLLVNIIDFNQLALSDDSYALYMLEQQEGGNYTSIVLNILFFCFIDYWMTKVRVTKSLNLLYNIVLLSLFLSLVGFKIDLMFRFAIYFGYFIPILFTNILTSQTNKTNNMKLYFPIVIVVFILLYIGTGIPISVNPYQFYWNSIPIVK